MKFCTAVSCMDGRIQIPVIKFLQNYFDAEYVDMITETGINKIISENKNTQVIEAINQRLNISVNTHNSVGIAVVGHYDCAGNPTTKTIQTEQTLNSVNRIKNKYPKSEVMGLWVNENWEVSKII